MKTGEELPDEEIAAALDAARGAGGKRSSATPTTRCSCRCASGARESMPGMLDTVLNLGLNDESVEGLAKATDNERFAWDSYRRFVQMFGNVCRGIPGERYEDLIKRAEVRRRRERGRRARRRRTCRTLTERFKELFHEETGEEFPQDPQEQLRQAITAVFDSWTGKRAVEYRRINHIPDEWGTAVNVQQMVFGNKGDSSCSGVAFSRDEITGEPTPSGDFLPNAQGEDVVSGVRTPRDLHDMKESMPEAHDDLMEILAHARAALRRHAGHRVHGRGGQPLHAPDPQRQAAGAGGRAVRGRRRGGGPARPRAGDRHDRRRTARRAAPPGLQAATPTSTCWPRACPPRRAPRRARSSSRPTTR